MSDPLTDEERILIEEFEKILSESDDEDDFGFFDTDNAYPAYPDLSDLDLPDLPPPILKEAIEEDECEHKDTKKVYITNMKAYIMCKTCKADLGDAE